MSYATMDHAAWVEQNIDAVRRGGNAKRKKTKEGQPRGWLAAPAKLNRFQARVMDICGVTFGGIYNAPISWDLIEWHEESLLIPIKSHRSFATWDFANLTRLVFLAHYARIRADICVNGRGFMLGFWQRSHQGGMGCRHPNLAEAVEEMVGYLPADHRIRYVAELDDPIPERNRRWVLNTACRVVGMWADEMRARIGAGNHSGARHSMNLLDRDADSARDRAAALGGGPELDAVVKETEALRAAARVAFNAAFCEEDIAA